MNCDVFIIGGGASGLMAGIAASSGGVPDCKVVVCDAMSSLGLKVLASGGKRCNVTNTLDEEAFMARFGKQGRFMAPALEQMGSEQLQEFLAQIGVPTDCPDGFRVWPQSRNAKTVVNGLLDRLQQNGVSVVTNTRVERVVPRDDGGFKIKTTNGPFAAAKVIVATGGLSYAKLGATGDGYDVAKQAGHSIVQPVPAGVPLVTKESWPARMTAHTMGKAQVGVNIKRYAKIRQQGDVIFTQTGIAGPVVLDLSGEISHLLTKLNEVPLVMNLCGGKTRQDWQQIFADWKRDGKSHNPLASLLEDHVPSELATILCELSSASPEAPLKQLPGPTKEQLIEVLCQTPLTITGTTGFSTAFVTRGGVSLKKVNPQTLESRLVAELYFCGEVLNLDGPCGGFNLQWAFASGYLAGKNCCTSEVLT